MNHLQQCLSVCLLFAAPLFAASDESSFKSDAAGKTPHPWTQLNFNDAPGDFSFSILSDRNGGGRPGVFERGVEAVNQLQPAFSMCVGDLLPGYSEDPRAIKEMRTEMNGILDKLEVPFFYVPGNHDKTNATMAPIYAKDIGPTYYHFVYKNTLFLILSTEEHLSDQLPQSDLTPAEVEYAAKVLKDNPSVRWTFVFMHKPLWDIKVPLENWAKMENLLKDRPHTVFAGHQHRYGYYQRNGNDYIKLGTTGGGNPLTGPDYGEFDEIVWVAMTGKAPRITNLNLDGILSKDLRTEKQEALAADFNLAGGGLFIDPVFSTTPVFSKAETKLRVVNPTDATLKIHAAFEQDKALKVTPAKLDLTIAPKSELKEDITLSAAEATNPEKLPMVKCSFDLGAMDKDKELPLARRGKMIAVQSLYPCAAAVKPVVIDGRLDEWGALPYTATFVEQGQKSYTGPKDANATFATSYDDQFLYVAMKMTDDKPVKENTKFTHDSFMMLLDARPDPERSFNTAAPDQRGKAFMFVEVWPGDKQGEVSTSDASALPESTKIQCVREGSTLTAEIAIPVAWLNAQQNGPWKSFRFDGGMQDMDSGDSTRKMIWWQPRWNKADLSPAGSGTFEKVEK